MNKMKPLELSLNSCMNPIEVMKRFADICVKMNEVIDVVNILTRERLLSSEERRKLEIMKIQAEDKVKI
ncbi:MAG: hypothetical protein ACTSW7_00940 [Candidatus Thorarchaeota archaeon]|nr:hypothetical protein [Thermoplasmatales archaeon]